jgi:hypothetical protein
MAGHPAGGRAGRRSPGAGSKTTLMPLPWPAGDICIKLSRLLAG